MAGFLLNDCTFADCRYILVNLYAPTIDKAQQQKVFGDYVLNVLQNYVGDNIIISDDLNINLDTVQQNIISSKNLGYAKIVHQIRVIKCC